MIRISIPAFALIVCFAADATAQLPQVLYYRMNEGTGAVTANDATPGGGAAQATLTGTVGWPTPGQLGNSQIDFTNGGSAASGQLNSGWATDLSTDWTIELWFQPNVSSGSVYYMFGDSTASTPTSFRGFIGGVAGTGVFVRTGYPDINVVPPFPVNIAGLWTHFALVHDSIGATITGYINGTMITQVAVTTPLNQMGTNFHVGSYTGSNSFNGSIDEFRFWNVARSAAEIQANYNTELGTGFELYGSGCAGTGGFVPTYFANGPVQVGNAGFAVGSSNLNGGVPAVFVLGLSDSIWLNGGSILLPLDLTPFGAPGCNLLFSTETLLGPFNASAGGPGAGSISVSLPIPNQAFLAGAVAYTGFIVIDVGANNLNVINTPAAKMTIQP